jgi:TRAP-type C4-dicarboxylate transport system permease small subunit
MNQFEVFVKRISNYLNWISGIGLIAMAVLAVGDIIGNKAFKYPLPGGIEVVGFLGVVVAAFAIAHTQIQRGHIEVEFIIERFPKNLQKIIYVFNYVCLSILWAVISWRMFDYALILQKTGEVSMTERIPFYPFVYGLSLCCLLTFMVFIVQLVREIGSIQKK